MTRRWWHIIIFIFALTLATGLTPDSRGADVSEPDEDSEVDALSIYFFPDASTFTIKTIEVPSGKVIEEETQDIEDTLGDIGKQIAKKYPKTWLLIGPITKTQKMVALPPELAYIMKFFHVEYLGQVAVKVPESDVYAPEPQTGSGPAKIRMEIWGEDPDQPPPGNGDAEDEPEEPEGSPTPAVDAYLQIWKFLGKKELSPQ